MSDHAVPFDRDAIRGIQRRLQFDVQTASIREVNAIVNAIERDLGVRFIRMEFGVPGLPASPIAIEAEMRALCDQQLAHVYAPFEGVPALKEEGARFWKLFTDLDLPPHSVVPTVGAMQACFASIALASLLKGPASTILCLDPGFPENKLQMRLFGARHESLDLYYYRGDALVRAIEARVRRGDVTAILWSSPNNPTWVVLNEAELAGIGRVCDRYDVFAIEDLAYFGMDTRRNYLVPGEPPFHPTVMRYTTRAITIVSSSKMFSYAGQRLALMFLSPSLSDLRVPALTARLGTDNVARGLIGGIVYPNIACAPESSQYGLLAMLKAANAGDQRLFEPARVYAARAKVMKRLFLEHGFHLVYDNDLGEPLADGFYFTIAYPGYENGADLMGELLHYGISAITLAAAGSCRREGLRACVSMTSEGQFDTLAIRLRRFHEDHPA
ncbi:MAG: pyridoxal phosphate-dependent aminotransferase [Acidobacteria bacterium]|nr:pyridoxal phosphate-dependent aminotransferase [Acidobacteriota bacterium]